MKKAIIATTLVLVSLTSKAVSPNEMLVVVGAVKYYNENCAGLNSTGIRQMNKGLKRFDMDNTPVYILETHPMAKSGYEAATMFGCEGTKKEAFKAGYGKYIN